MDIYTFALMEKRAMHVHKYLRFRWFPQLKRGYSFKIICCSLAHCSGFGDVLEDHKRDKMLNLDVRDAERGLR